MTSTTLDGSLLPYPVLPGTTITVDTGDILGLLGSIELLGTILAAGTGTFGSQGQPNDGALAEVASIVTDSPTVTLSGGGSIQLNGSAFNVVYGGLAGGSVLVNAGVTIEGSGSFGVGTSPYVLTDGTAYPVGLVNEAGGTIDATGTQDPSGNLDNGLFVSPGGATLDNAGLIESTGNAGLYLSAASIANTGGTLSASSAGDNWYIDADLVAGGLLEAASGATLDLSGMSGTSFTLAGVAIQSDTTSSVVLSGDNGVAILDGTASAVTISAGSTLGVSGVYAELTGTIVDAGTILIPTSNYGFPQGVELSGSIDNLGTIVAADLTPILIAILLGTPTVTLGGGGTLLLSDTGSTEVTSSGATPSTLLNVDNVIAGAGAIGVAAQYGSPASAVALDNEAAGIVDANDATLGLSLYGGGATLRNAGLIEATATGGLVVAGASLDNTGGTLLASGAGDIIALQSLDVTGGLLEATGGGELLFNSGTSTLESGASLLLDAGSTLEITTTLLVGSTLTLSGGGEVLLYGGTLDGNGAASIVNVSDTIEGSSYAGGVLGTAAATLSLTNDAAGVVGNLDLEEPGGLRNAGTLEGLAGGTLETGLTAAATIDNRGGTILATGGTVLLVDATVTGGTLASNAGGTIAIGLQGYASTATLDGRADAVTIAAGTTLQTFYTEISLPFTLDYGSAVDFLGTIDDLGGTVLGSLSPYGGSPTTNAGLFEGSGAIVGAITNDGTLLAQNGDLSASSVYGSGSIAIASGATFELGTASSEAIDFQGLAGSLVFDSPVYHYAPGSPGTVNYTGALTNLVSGDTIDLAGLSVASATVLPSDTLSVGFVDGTSIDYALANLQAGASFDLASATPTPTETYSFTYAAGPGAANPDYSATGTGSFTVDVGTGTAGLGDVTAFSLTLDVTDTAPYGAGSGGTDVITYGQNLLTGFAATFGAGNVLASLSLTTNYGSDTTFPGHTYDQQFDIAGLGAGQASTNTPGFGVDTMGAVTVAAPVQQFSDLVVACFAGGTRIAGDRGERAVETLVPGDRVTTASGNMRRVIWTGHRRIDCTRHPRPYDVLPVCVRAGAFAPGVPHTDLVLSPDHAVFADGVLIPVRYLVNGATVERLERTSVTYWHVELDAHDVLLAEGLPCESYLDTGNRGAFIEAEGAVAMHPDFARAVWATGSCAPLRISGAEVTAVRSLLLERAGELGHAASKAAELSVVVDGAVVPGSCAADGLWRFRLPARSRTARLVSPAAAPAEMLEDAEDHRHLGVAVSKLLRDGAAVPLDSPDLGAGWHAPEVGWRWTDGAAEIECRGAAELAFAVALVARHWASPAVAPAARRLNCPAARCA